MHEREQRAFYAGILAYIKINKERGSVGVQGM